MSNRLVKGDEVVVISGNDKGKTGKILNRVGGKLLVEGINLRKKHRKASNDVPGSIIDIEVPIDASNVALSHNGKPVRLHVRTSKKGEKELYFNVDGKEIVHRKVGK